ncbi:MAG: hypothetical protein Q7K16_03865 [Candidatus Azambacteria bacterium]|nr:hypothetical protein [Candidatus Azambacteria bacterium]
MENILIFAVTAAVYYFVWFFFTDPVGWKKQINRIALVAFLTLPLNIDGNVFTVIGNATSEKNVYSLSSVYQKAEKDTFTLISLLGTQRAGQDAITIIGFSRYQQSKKSVIGIGFVGYQRAEQEATTVLAVALYQRVGERTRAFGAFSTLAKE